MLLAQLNVMSRSRSSQSEGHPSKQLQQMEEVPHQKMV